MMNISKLAAFLAVAGFASTPAISQASPRTCTQIATQSCEGNAWYSAGYSSFDECHDSIYQECMDNPGPDYCGHNWIVDRCQNEN